jgi:hypothetical protein
MCLHSKKFRKKRNKCLTADIAKIFIDSLENSSKAYVHWVEQVVERMLVVVEQLVDERDMVEELVEELELDMVEELVEEQEQELELDMVEELVEEQEQGQELDMVEELVEEQEQGQELVEERELAVVQKFVVALVIVIVDKVASLVHRLLLMNVACPWMEMHHLMEHQLLDRNHSWLVQHRNHRQIHRQIHHHIHHHIHQRNHRHKSSNHRSRPLVKHHYNLQDHQNHQEHKGKN